ncbi:MAG: ABC transporter permease [Spirochaetes bacterium]|nr:ABC transporter permease [Spirochaetota bacterium]
MLAYIIRRILYMIPTLILISIVSFIIIQLPPGDWVTSYAAQLRAQGTSASKEALEALRTHYGLDKPIYVQYFKWVSGFPRLDFGIAMSVHNAPVSELLGGRLLLTLIVSSLTLFFTLVIAIPIGIYSATHKYTVIDSFLSVIAFISLSMPPFLLALIFIFVPVFYFGAQTVGGLFSPEYIGQPLTWGKIIDLIKHLPTPVAVLTICGTGGIAAFMRLMRANLLDILGEQYIQTGRAKGLKERVVIYKHAVRIAINPIISRIGVNLPELFSGTIIVAIVLNLPTIGPLFYRGLIAQDMYLAGSILLVLAVILLFGNLAADIMLAWSDPRIRYD